jgi:hypothetical protein
MTNYMPIALLTVFPIYPKRYAQQLHTNNILITEQYGFMKGIPTENAAFTLTDCVLKCINQNNACGRNFLLLGKGF